MATVGIDFGTSYLTVGVWRTESNTVELVANDQGNRCADFCHAPPHPAVVVSFGVQFSPQHCFARQVEPGRGGLQ